MQASSNTHIHTSHHRQTERQIDRHIYFLALSSGGRPLALWPLPRLLLWPGSCILGMLWVL